MKTYLSNKYLLHINTVLVLDGLILDEELLAVLVCGNLCLDNLGGDLLLHDPHVVA